MTLQLLQSREMFWCESAWTSILSREFIGNFDYYTIVNIHQVQLFDVDY
jgi:hypothetical protein